MGGINAMFPNAINKSSSLADHQKRDIAGTMRERVTFAVGQHARSRSIRGPVLLQLNVDDEVAEKAGWANPVARGGPISSDGLVMLSAGSKFTKVEADTCRKLRIPLLQLTNNRDRSGYVLSFACELQTDMCRKDFHRDPYYLAWLTRN